MSDFVSVFSDLEDPRYQNARHSLPEILFMALIAMLCGAESCVDMANFADAKEDELREFLELRHGPPSHDTFSRIFRLLDPDRFGACFCRFMASFAAAREGVVAIDGKTLRRSFDRAAGQSPLHMLSAFASQAGLALGQRAVDGKSNEIKALPELLKMLSLTGRTVTVDAMHCQKEAARSILEQHADYVMALKGNQATLHSDVALFLDDPATAPDDVFETVEKSHGRIETRHATVTADVAWLSRSGHDWPGLKAIGKVVATREIGGKATTSSRYYLLSRAMPAERFAAIVRSHWAIENSLHWVLDVIMNEDQARNRKDNGPENLALLRKWALNIIKGDKAKGSNRVKFKRAGWDNKFLRSLVTQISP